MLMFTEEQLRDLIAGRMIGHAYPYDTNDDGEVEAHIRRLFYRINRIPGIICEAEWDHFGSGYASFVEFYCYKEEDQIVTKNKWTREVRTEGLLIYISRLAPVAIMGEDARYKTLRNEKGEVTGGVFGSLTKPSDLRIGEGFLSIAEKITEAIEEFDYELLKENMINMPLPFQVKIPTIYSEPRDYTIMHAIFYWED